jgi:phosphoglycerate-specific signal transduction histidine kinase
MDKNYARDLFQLQTELVDKKVDMAVSNAIERVMHELSNMRKDMHSFRHDVHSEIHALRRDMDHQFSSLKERVTAVESTLTYVRNSQNQISTKFIDYTFKAGWIMLGGSVSYIVARFFGIIG